MGDLEPTYSDRPRSGRTRGPRPPWAHIWPDQLNKQRPRSADEARPPGLRARERDTDPMQPWTCAHERGVAAKVRNLLTSLAIWEAVVLK